MRKLLAVVVFALMLGACALPKSPQQQLAVVELTFTGIVDQLTEARINGDLSNDMLWACAKTLILATDQSLDNARAALIRGQSIAIFIGKLQVSVRTLRRLEATRENVCELSSSDTTDIRRYLIRPTACHDVQRDRSHDGRGGPDRVDPRGMGTDQIET